MDAPQFLPGLSLVPGTEESEMSSEGAFARDQIRTGVVPDWLIGGVLTED